MEQQRGYGTFCQAYLRTMDPERAARAAGSQDGFSMLGNRFIQTRLEKMRENASSQIRREDAVRRLAQLAFGQANDAVKLALGGRDTDVDTLDLSAVTEVRVSDKGGVELKLVDRVRALESLCALLETGGGTDAQAVYQALAEGGEEAGWDHE